MPTTQPQRHIVEPGIPAFLQRRAPEARFMVDDELSLIITAGDQMITLGRPDLEKLRAFLARFEREEDAQ